MDFNAIADVIATVGFPIAMCCYLVWDTNGTKKDLMNLVRNNTEAVTKMTEKLDDLLGRDK